MKWLDLLLGKRPAAPIDWPGIEAPINSIQHLDETERARLRADALAFCQRKKFYGAAGLELTDAIKLTIALNAVLLTRRIGLQVYDSFSGIVVYPGEFIVPQQAIDEAGVVHAFDETLSGQAWDGGPVLLSWWDEPPEINVILHEFAHKLDMATDAANGCPNLPADIDPQHWQSSFTQAFEDFCQRAAREEDMGLDPYGAENPAEFFAVMTEAFFETPAVLRDNYPAIYALLAKLYGQDPARSP